MVEFQFQRFDLVQLVLAQIRYRIGTHWESPPFRYNIGKSTTSLDLIFPIYTWGNFSRDFPGERWNSVLSEFRQTLLIVQYVRTIFPAVDRELAAWRLLAEQIPDVRLQEQAIASLQAKRFHAQGGAIYGLYPGLSRTAREETVRFIVAYQTISDYLDNLCDRAGVETASAFWQLHLAMEEALTPGKPLSDYYHFYPFTEDGGYLAGLVRACQAALLSPTLAGVQPVLCRWAQRYANLQTHKHIRMSERAAAMERWLAPLIAKYPGFRPWELAAASGSTLGIFYFAALAKIQFEYSFLAEAEEAYYPWVNAFHILLDYFIDRMEDKENGDLNLVAGYISDAEMAERMTYIFRTANARTAGLPHPDFHRAVLNGLLAMYLSDPKAREADNQKTTAALLAGGGWYVRFLLRIITILRGKRVI